MKVLCLKPCGCNNFAISRLHNKMNSCIFICDTRSMREPDHISQPQIHNVIRMFCTIDI
jgi:hypothetical protein